MKPSAAIFFCLFIAACPKPSPPALPPKPKEPHLETSSKNIARDLEYLTSPELEGRGPQTKGLSLAADYIAAQMREMGLTPSAPNGSYFSLLSDKNSSNGDWYDLGSSLHDDQGIDYRLYRDFFVLNSSPNGELKAELVFAAYGEKKDFEGLDVSGKIVLLLYNKADLTRAKSYFTQLDGYKTATSLGASAILFVNPSWQYRDWIYFNQSLLFTDPHQNTGPFTFTMNSYIVLNWLTPKGEVIPDLSPRPLPEVLTLKVSQAPDASPLKNVIGVLEPETSPKKTILIGAHYDHLGTSDGVVYPGADDNASGITALLETARALASSDLRPPVRIIFCAFTVEERGLVGSKDYLNGDHEHIDYMLNFDMVGRLQNNTLYIGGEAFSFFGGALRRADKELGLLLTQSLLSPREGSSDHQSFIDVGIPALHFFTGLHSDVHRPTDTADKINVEGIAKISKLAAFFVYELAKLD
jgi:hypothetical protein